MQISARGDYAVRAALSLATAYPSLLSTQAIAAGAGHAPQVPGGGPGGSAPAGIVRAQRGAEGGYTLARPPRE
ncbi:Rrf2 family transcriptional regulator, partial [Micromonospora sp. STR1s_5]|nr:Rrf2 family transcriptional regulator [Micromonospora sp. STR1s_5]